MQAHFDSIQRIADTTTLPHAMQYLNSRVMEELDVYHLMERLKKGKDQPNPLTSAEKIELWDRLKFLSMNLSLDLFMQLVSFDVGLNEASLPFAGICVSPGFTRLVLSLWSMTILNLYIRVQVNILGRHLYINTARNLGSSLLPVRTMS